MRFLLIANPVSGDARMEAKIEAALAYFAKHADSVDLRFTEYPGHATSIAREGAFHGYDAIIGAGGDGTINEVLNGIVGTGARLGVLPWGTGNVFAKEMRISSRIKKQCKLIRKGKAIASIAAAAARSTLSSWPAPVSTPLPCGAAVDFP